MTSKIGSSFFGQARLLLSLRTKKLSLLNRVVTSIFVENRNKITKEQSESLQKDVERGIMNFPAKEFTDIFNRPLASLERDYHPFLITKICNEILRRNDLPNMLEAQKILKDLQALNKKMNDKLKEFNDLDFDSVESDLENISKSQKSGKEAADDNRQAAEKQKRDVEREKKKRTDLVRVPLQEHRNAVNAEKSSWSVICEYTLMGYQKIANNKALTIMSMHVGAAGAAAAWGLFKKIIMKS